MIAERQRNGAGGVRKDSLVRQSRRMVPVDQHRRGPVDTLMTRRSPPAIRRGRLRQPVALHAVDERGARHAEDLRRLGAGAEPVWVQLPRLARAVAPPMRSSHQDTLPSCRLTPPSTP